MIRSNFHTHTIFCDGANPAEEMVQRALELGFTQLGFSGHMDPDIHMDLPAYQSEIRRLQDKYRDRIDILMGVELDNLYDVSAADGAEYVIGSTHFLDINSEIPMSVDNTPEMMAQMCTEFFSGDYYALSKAYYELEAQVYDRTKCTFIGHFDLVTRFNDQMHFLDEEDPRYLGPALEAMEHLVKQGLPFEINAGAFNRGRKREFYPNNRLLKALHEFDGEILINSDAHSAALLNGGFEEAEQAALANGFTHYNILCHNEHGEVEMRQKALGGNE